MSMDLTKDELATQEMIKMLEEVDDVDDTQAVPSPTEKAGISNIELTDIDDDELDTSDLTVNDTPMPSFTSIGEASVQHHHDLDEASIQAVMDELEEKDNIPTVPPKLHARHSVASQPVDATTNSDSVSNHATQKGTLMNATAKPTAESTVKPATPTDPKPSVKAAPVPAQPATKQEKNNLDRIGHQLSDLLASSGVQMQQAIDTVSASEKALKVAEDHAKKVLSVAVATTEAKQQHIAKTNQLIEQLTQATQKVKALTDQHHENLNQDQMAPMDEARMVQDLDRLKQSNMALSEASKKLSDRLNHFNA